ncbi:hypothetical protein IW152_006153 [Coemansia sp. BCRC 34962]|nr:hypothetical protein IW152_006153 [Coemansia sp. BCRC 34962]
MSLNSAASSSSLYSGGSFPAMPPSPAATTAAPEHICFLATSASMPATTGSSPMQQKCLSPAAYSTRCSSRVNLEGSWLDLESDAEGDDSYSLMRMRRKSSGASSKGSASGRNALAANLKELTRRSSMHLRKLTAKMGTN